MAYTLKNRQMQIPGGYRYLQGATGWQPRRFASFAVVVNGLISHRKANPALVAQHKWSTDQASVEQEVDAFNARLCVQHGWMDYVHDGGAANTPSPKTQALLQSEKSVIAAAAGKAKKIWGGIRTLNEWIDSGTPPVPQDQANSRAAVCSVCTKNGKGGLEEWFTRPASEVIAKQFEKLRAMKFITKFDDKLQVCTACLCPLKMAVHTPLKYKMEHMSSEVMQELKSVQPECWVITESSK